MCVCVCVCVCVCMYGFWTIFLWTVRCVSVSVCLSQIVQALRYLHKEKKIVHRDLTPNNIMLGENNKVTISKLQVMVM